MLIETVRALDPETHRQGDTFTETTTAGGDTLRVYDVVPLSAADIAALQAEAIAKNNARAGAACAQYITVAPGQSERYEAKRREAERWAAAGRPEDASAVEYPWAADRAELLETTVSAVLAEWEAIASAWEVPGRLIEKERERVNVAIAAAGSPSAIRAALASASYPTS